LGLHEKMKQSIIAEEVIGYFLEKGLTKLDLSIQILEKQTTFVVVIEEQCDRIIADLREKLYCCRDQELEEYGWELFTDHQPSELLQSLGMLIDHFAVEEKEDKAIITFVRYHR